MRLSLASPGNAFYASFSAAAANLVTAAALLQKGLAPGADRDEMALEMRDLEHAGDDITHGVLRQLNASFVTPFDREDISRLAERLDDVMDHLEATAELASLYELRDLPQETYGTVDLLVRAADSTVLGLAGLRSRDGLEAYWNEVRKLEHEADRIYRRTVRRIFSGEYEVLTAFKLKDLTDGLEAAANAFEHVADTVETMTVKEA